MNKIKYILLITALILTTVNISLSQEGETFLWEVKSESNTVYVLGSIHVAKEELYPLDERITNAFEDSQFLVVEVRTDNANQFTIMQNGTLPDGTSLKDILADSTYKKLQALADENPMLALSMNKLKPSLLGTVLTMLELQKAGYNPIYGIDLHFINLANEREIEILELETLEYQLSVLDKFNDYPDEYINSTINEIHKTLEMIDTMFEAWQSGDVEVMEDILDEADNYPELKEVMEELIDNRNVRMTEKIEQYLENKDNYFVVVGAGHLVGENGIIELLKKSKRYTIKQY